MGDEKIYGLLEKMYTEFTNRFGVLEKEFSEIKNSQIKSEQEIAEIKSFQARLENRLEKLEIHIETELIDKVRALFDGYQLHTEQLNRIEEKVSTHEEIIFKRIK